MRKQNNYKNCTVIFSLLLLGQALSSLAGETSGSLLGTDTPYVSTGVSTEKIENQGSSEASSQQDSNRTNEPKSNVDASELNQDATNYFDILEFQVEGNTKLSAEKIEAAVYPQMGEKKSISDVEKAREALEKAYHEAGFLTVLVDIPEQDVDKKVVKLNVTEGKVGRLRVKDSDYYSLGRIKHLAQSVKEGEVPHFPTLQKDISRLNRTSDKRVTPVMKAGKAFGTVDVDLKVEDNLPLHASLELNDRFNNGTSRMRLAGMLRYDNLWQREHSLSLNFITSPEDTNEVKVLSANYLMRFDESDMLLALYGVKSKSNVGLTIATGGLNVLGNANIFGARLIKPLPALDNYYHSVSFGLDYKDFGQKVGLDGGPDGEEKPITYVPLSASYNGSWQQALGRTQLTTGVTLGIRGLVADADEFSKNQDGAKPNFFVAKADLQHTQNLPMDFQGFAKISGQFSGTTLIANERFFAGGVDTVRGYREAEALGDQAVHSTLEIRTPSMFKSSNWLQQLRLSAFYDIAQIRIINPVDQDRKSILSGAGFGLRLNTYKKINLSLDLAWALNDSPSLDEFEVPITKKGDFQSHMRLWYEF
ncbi:MAG: ShlB/FhaC/HecB family hemolysin secretion/activation protein [Methylotenera sp.]|nr:ShlB/FhaC/HecB family hemolysin secretion/activation protein [Methylotenera sp.]MDP2404421.1 ShlB/FhaC/HecB family hemolysin secretion/activation protein [Methylotenera sp.]MDZ4222328.1 ShlB/FhaC/HecB family hemolysin secretion/activation protein [Methylotenera sp.]